MSIGRFAGSRLRDARLARSLTASMLAERVGITPGAISNYELRDAEPRPATLHRLGEILDLPQTYFLRGSLSRDLAPYLYRSRSAATKRARESAEARYAWLREIVRTIEAHVEFPEADLLVPEVSVNPTALSDDDIEQFAHEVRVAWRLGDGPIPNVVSFLELMGCIVGTFAFGADELSAFSQAAEDRPYVILNADENASVRRRFNAAHELGHLILHRHLSPAEVARPETHKLVEHQAHRFAAAFLFPERAFAEEVYSLSVDSLMQVKSRWRVSMQMMLRRARDLGLVSQDRYERSFRELSRRGYRRREPMDDEIPVETPRLLARSIEMLIDEHVVTKESVMHELPFSQTDVEVLTGLPRGYLGKSTWGQVTPLRIREGAPRGGSEIPPGRVVRFPAKPRA